MRTIIAIIFLSLLAIQLANAQGKIAQFVAWEPLKGAEMRFEQGYKEHLKWHKLNKDPWNWYGWYAITGPRAGQFIDATFNHSWTDFDNAIKPIEDLEDNRINVFPYGKVTEVYKSVFLPNYSTHNSTNYSSRLIRMVTMDAISQKPAHQVLLKLRSEFGNQKMAVFRVLDGATLNRYYLMFFCDSNAEMAQNENLMEKINEIEREIDVRAFTYVISETLLFRKDLSLLDESEN